MIRHVLRLPKELKLSFKSIDESDRLIQYLFCFVVILVLTPDVNSSSNISDL